MRMTLIAVAAIGLTTGACTLTSSGGPGAYSALQPETTGVIASPENRMAAAPLPEGFVEAPSQSAMPGELRRPLAEAPGGRTEPVAALGASARARKQWETLHPGELALPPVAAQRAARAGSPGTTSSITMSAASAAAANTKSYDRDAAMQNLIDDGRSAGKGICSGC